MFRLYVGSVMGVSTLWCPHVLVRRVLTLVRSISSCVLTLRRVLFVWCSEWAVRAAGVRDESSSYWRRDERNEWESSQTHYDRFTQTSALDSNSLSFRRITRVRAAGAVSTRASWETSTVFTCFLTVLECCPLASPPHYTRCTSAALSFNTQRRKDAVLWRVAGHRLTQRAAVRDAAVTHTTSDTACEHSFISTHTRRVLSYRHNTRNIRCVCHTLSGLL